MIDLGLSDDPPEVNPFHFGPAGPDEFVGRWPLIKEMAVQMTRGLNSYACIGGRRFGKSSILNVLGYVLQHEKTLSGRVLILRVDPLLHRYATPEDVFCGFNMLLHHRALETVEKLRHQQAAINLPSQAPPTDYDEALYTIGTVHQVQPDDVTAEAFSHAINDVLNVLEEIGGPRRVVILLDEMDSFLDMPDHVELFGQLRACIYDGPACSRLRLVLAGSSRFVQEETRRGSPLWNMLQKEYLVAFDEAGTEELTTRLPEVNDSLRQAIWRESGGHPFIGTYLLYHLKQRLLRHPNQLLTADYVDTLVGRFLQTEMAHLNGWSKAVGLTGLQIYGLFFEEEGWLARRAIVERVGDPKLDVTAALNALCYHGFLLPDEAWGHFQRNGLVFWRWYQNEIARLSHELTPRRDGQLFIPRFFRDLIVQGPLQSVFDQREQKVGGQTNIAGGVNTEGGMFNAGTFDSEGGDVVGRDHNETGQSVDQ